MKIRIRAIIIILLTNLAIILFSILAGTGYVKDNIDRYIEADMLVVADIADRFISSELSMLKHEAQDAAKSLSQADEGDWARVLDEQGKLYPEYIGMAVLERPARVAAAAGERPASSKTAQNDAVQRAFLGKSGFSSTVPEEGGVVFYLATPIPNRDGAALVLTLDGMHFRELTSEYTLWETGHIFIDDSEGTIIANIREEWVQNRQNFIRQAEADPKYDEIASVINKAVAGERGIEYYALDGVRRICAYRPVSGSEEGWVLGIVAPLSESPVRNVDRGMTIIAAICFLLSVAAAVIASGFIKRPFVQVAALKERAEASLCEQQKLVDALGRRDTLTQAVNRAIELLLRSEPEDFSQTLRESMGMMAQALKADRIHFHKNHYEDGKRYTNLLYEWRNEAMPPIEADGSPRFFCDESTLGVQQSLGGNESIHSLVGDMPEACRKCLGLQNARAIMLIPIFLRNEFWGFVGFDNCHSERLLSENEESVMRSGSLLVASAILRNEYMQGLRETSEKLEAALIEAEKANNAKSDFLAHMSHEIRTPLNAVIGLSELTLGEGGLNKAAETNLETIYAAGSTILSIINDILDIAKIESGRLELYPVRYDTPSLINDIVTLNIVRIGEKPIDFKLTLDEALPSMLVGDDLRVKQIFNNLLSNAFKYTNAGSVEWRLGYERSGGDVWLVSSISDTGVGIKPEDAARLFTDYHQADAKNHRAVQGTGLGLSISRRLARMMDGEITFQSEYGKGSVFTVRLRQAFVSDTPIGAAVTANLSALRYTLSKRSTDSKLARVDLSYAHVLLVDDIATNLDVVKGMLKPYGVKADCCNSGRQAIERIRSGVPRYSAVFMDHMMPGMDGIEATRIIRELGTPYAREIPIIALTANAIIGNEEMFLSKGFQAFISKPIDITKLDAALRRWVRDKAREQELADTSVGEAATGGEGISGMTIDGVDIPKALARFSGDEGVLTDVLRSFAANTHALLTDLGEYLKEGNLADYAIVVHGVKGSANGIYATDVGKAAQALEFAAKAGEAQALAAGHPPFIEITRALLGEIERALAALDLSSSKPLLPEPDPALLAQLRAACAAFDMDGVDAAMGRLEACRYQRGGEIIGWLRARVDAMAFEEISLL